MKDRYVKLVALLVLVGGTAAASHRLTQSQAQERTKERAEGLPQYEYKIVKTKIITGSQADTKAEKLLNEYGAQGWLAENVIYNSNRVSTMGTPQYLVLRRRVR